MDPIILPFERPIMLGFNKPKTGRAARAQEMHDRKLEIQPGYKDHIRSALGIAPSLKVEILSFEQAIGREADWQDLVGRSLESNLFYEPAFAFAAGMHLPEAGKPYFAFIVNNSGRRLPQSRLLGIFPFTVSRLDIGVPVLRGWHYVNNAVGTPLVDHAHAEKVIIAFMDYAQNAAFSGIIFPKLLEDGAFAQTLKRAVTERGCNIAPISSFERAQLTIGVSAKDYVKKSWSAKKIKELQRQRRRLADIAPLGVLTAKTPQDVACATERFLTLEVNGWKGRNGTGMIQKTGRATFMRSMLRSFAHTSQIEIHELYCGKTLVSSAILLKSNQAAYFWKIAYNESFAKFSPGVLLTQDLTTSCLNDLTLEKVDSCAVQSHPMIDHLWNDRLLVSDWLVGVSTENTGLLKIALIREKFRRKVREYARALYIKLKRGKNN